MFSLHTSGFRVHNLYVLKRPSLLHVAKQKISFAIASFSLFAFVIGNMVGQHGWYSFWKSVLGKDDMSIVFVGTVSPVNKVPDYSKWAQYGGNPEDHTFRMVPKDILISLPSYDPQSLRDRSNENISHSVYSVGFLGSYETGNDHDGSHVGVDIRMPVGTPIVSIANGIVEKVQSLPYGFGNYIVVRHPNVPDPDLPGKATTLYSVYAHLDALLVSEGQIVHKGEQIALSGRSGDVSGPHLHFQIDKADAPYHPYWPFTGSEVKEARLSNVQAINTGFHQDRGALYTVSPLVFVQQHLNATSFVAVTEKSIASSARSLSSSRQYAPGERLKLRAEERMRLRLAKKAPSAPTHAAASVASIVAETPSLTPITQSVEEVSQVKTATVHTSATPPLVSPSSNTDVDHLEISHSGKLTRSWQKVKIMALDQDGNLVKSPSFSGRLFVRADFGEADIRPSEITTLDFVEGVATVNVLSRSLAKPIFIVTKGAFETTSVPMVPVR